MLFIGKYVVFRHMLNNVSDDRFHYFGNNRSDDDWSVITLIRSLIFFVYWCDDCFQPDIVCNVLKF